MASLSFSSFQTLFPRPCRHCNAIPNFGSKPRTGPRILSGTGSDPDPPLSDELGLISSSERFDGSVVFRFGNARDVVVEKTRSSSGQAVSRSVRRKRRKKVEEGVVAVEVSASGSSLLSGDDYGVVEAKDSDVDRVTTGLVSSRLNSEDEPKERDIDGVTVGSVSSDTDLKAEAKGSDVHGLTTGPGATELDLEAEAKDSIFVRITSGSVSSELDLEDEVKESEIDGVSSGSVASQLDLEDEVKDNDVDGVLTGSVTFKLDLDKKDRNVDGVMTGSVSFELDLESGAKDSDFDGVITGSVSFELDLDQAKDRNADEVLTGSVSFKLDLKDDEAKDRNVDEVNTDLLSSKLDLEDGAKDGNDNEAMTDTLSSQIDSEAGGKDSTVNEVKIHSVSYELHVEVDKAKDSNVNRVTIGSVSSKLDLEDRVKTDSVSSELDLEDDEAKDSDVDGITIDSSVSSANSLEDKAKDDDLYGVITESISSQLDLEDEAKESNVDGVTTGSVSSELDSGPLGLNDNPSEAPTDMSEAKEMNGMEPSHELLSEISVDEKLGSFHHLVCHNASSTTEKGAEAIVRTSNGDGELPVDEDPKSEEISTRELVLSSGASLLLQQPTEGLAGAEDAYFVACQNWLGVTDGVAQWSLQGVSSGVYARELMKNCERIVLDFKGSPRNNPGDVLVRAAAETKSPGSSTILVAHFDGKAFHVANIGDSGFVIIRDSYIFRQSSPTVHEFNFPLHIERGDDPSKLIQSYKIDLEEGDVIVTATDGLFDNLYDQEIASFATKSLKSGLNPQDIAESLAHKAQEVARSPSSSRTPFSDAAQVAGYAGYSGGKLDDVAVIVSVIENKQSI